MIILKIKKAVEEKSPEISTKSIRYGERSRCGNADGSIVRIGLNDTTVDRTTSTLFFFFCTSKRTIGFY